MQRITTLASACLAGLVLIAPTSAAKDRRAPARATVNVEIEHVDPDGPPQVRLTSGPRTGIRSYGTHATRIETFLADPFEPQESTSPRTATRSVGVGQVSRISGASMAGGVTFFAVSSDGSTAVYVADQDTAGLFELYSTPVDGSAAPTKISAGLVFGAGDNGVSSFQISPDGSRVAFLADPTLGGGTDDIYSVPIDGSSSPVQLNLGPEAPVTAFGFTRNSAHVAFFGIDTNFGSGGVELYAASAAVASSATQISDASDTNAAGNVSAADFSPDSSTMVYAADSNSAGVFQWFSVPIAAAGPGADVQISSALGSVGLVAISPDSNSVVYTGDDILFGVVEVFSVPIGGGAATRLNPVMAGDVTSIEISPDGSRVGYLADQDTAGVTEVYSAMIGSAGSSTRLNTPMSGTQTANTLNISPDSTTVLYEADQNTAGTQELFGAPIDGSGAPTTLQPMVPPNDVGFFTGLGTPIVGRRSIYPVFGSSVNLFSVPYDGTGGSVQLNDPLGSGDTVLNAFLPVISTRLMAYGFGASSGTVTEVVEVAPIRADLIAEQINVTAGPGADGVLGYAIAPTEDYAIYVQDQNTLGKPELYSRELDSDADTVINATDNCPFVANPAQGAIVLGQTVNAVSKSEFAWSNPTEVRYVRGPLAMVDVYATNDSGTLADATSHLDATTPAVSGTGFYYLFAPDCPGRSYQNALGSEPGRDAAGLP